MPIVTFYSNKHIETSQTTSMAAIATYLAVRKNYKILLVNTKYNDTSLQECFWEQPDTQKMRTDMETGISGLIKAIASNKTSPEIITNYTKTVFKEKLQILTDDMIPKEDYEKQKAYMKAIIKIASKYYDLVFVDLEGDIEDPFVRGILYISNLVVANTSQRIKYIKEFTEAMNTKAFIRSDRVMILLGRYDKYSKYNIKNLQRSEKIHDIYGIPYNTLFFEVCNEGQLTDFIFIKPNKIQSSIMEAISEVSERIISKLKEIQMHG